MHLRLGLALGVLLAVLMPATALAGPTVTVRVEGSAGTLLPARQVTLGDAPYSAGSATCPADSAFAALDTAVAGNWDRANFFNTVLGETHNFADSDYWAVWVGRAGGYLYGNGVCSQALQPGDELLLLVDRSPPPSYNLTVFPLKLSGVPAIVAPGAPFTVKVDEYRPDAMGTPGSGTGAALAGATVASGSASATTGADGTATLALTARGPATVRASTPGTRSLPADVCVTDGSDGFCDTVKPSPLTPQAAPDVTPALGRIAGLGEHERFARGKGPRELKGTVDADASGIKDVRLRLTRTVGTRCERFDPVRERWVKAARCGVENAPFFSIGSSAAWSYLLPAALTKGRYVLDTQTVDGAGNVTRGATRGGPGTPRTRVVFFVG